MASPLMAVAVVFRPKGEFAGLPYVISMVSCFLDTSVELPLDVACTFGSLSLLDRIWESSIDIDNDSWTLRKFIRTELNYMHYQASKSMMEAVHLKDLEMVRWLAVRFPGFRVSMEVMNLAATSGVLDILQFFYDHSIDHQDTLLVAWLDNYLAAGVHSQKLEVVEWLYAHGPSEERKLNQALQAAVGWSNIPIAEWLLAHGATWEVDAVGLHPAHSVMENSGSVEMLQWLDEQGQLDCIKDLLVKAASGGYIDAVHWLLDRSQRGVDIRLAIHKAASNGHLEIARLLYSRAEIPQDRDMRELQRVEDEQQLGYKINYWSPMVSGQSMFEASRGGFLDVVQWLYMELGDYPDIDLFNYREMRHESAMDAAAANGHLNVLRFLHELQNEMHQSKTKRGLTLPICTTAAMDGAAANGHLAVVQWLHEHRNEGCTAKAMDRAARNGYLDVVKWLFKNRPDGYAASAMDSAAESGNLELVKWLHFNTSVGCTTAAMDNAAESGSLDILEWLNSNRSEGCSKKAMVLASVNGYVRVVKWLYSHWSSMRSSSGIQTAATLGHFEIVLFLHDHCLMERLFPGEIVNYDISAWVMTHQQANEEDMYDY
ncbi:putative ankyrin repeat protein [Phytophthora citrophthora]|uniref:Ankyrin repeat protein n=1 Tax=Phytophthora citrophthora TaxID=4793 RepID=A0AAD9LL68_9STRA|nr:putative ankyrin repeat protein [Phytophthora citrophthora]